MAKQSSKISFRQGMTYMIRSFGFMGKQRIRFWTGAMFSCLELLVAYITPILFQSIIRILETGSIAGEWRMMMALFAVSLAAAPLITLGDYWKKKAVIETEKNMSVALFSKVQSLPLEILQRYDKGDYVTRIVSDTHTAVNKLSGYTFKALLKFVVYTAISMAILIWTDPVYAAVGLFMSVTALVITFFFSPMARRVEQRAKTLVSGLAAPLMEAIVNAPVIRVFSMETKLQKEFAGRCGEVAGERIRFRTMNGTIEAFIYLFSYCVKPVTFLMGIYLLTRGEMDIATIVYLSGITGILSEGIQDFSQFIQNIQSGFVSLDRIYELLDMDVEKKGKGTEAISPETLGQAARRPENGRSGDGRPGDGTLPLIRIRGLHFRYSGREEILKGIDLDIPAGQKAAIVGRSGCGKSTLVKLIIGLYEPTEGTVTIGNARNLSGNLVAYVSQACDIFRGSVRENIGYGKEGASFEEIVNAARRAGSDGFIESLPQGYETLIDENGTNLSGGQKQRIAIARALLSEAPILVLDEVTSAMDAATEENILSDLLKETEDRTVLMITHKIRVAARMERILVMEGGRITESGSHAELLAAKGWYYRAYREQSAESGEAGSGVDETGLTDL